MDHTYWHKQTLDKPLFPDLLWSRPENKVHAGKLLIIGGNAHGFAAPAEAYTESQRAGVGLTRVLLPQHVKGLLPKSVTDMEFAPSTPSGSFSQAALGELLDASSWADGVLLAGDLGRNSETAILLERYAKKYEGPLSLVNDAVDYFLGQSMTLLNRPQTCIVPTLSQLQKILAAARSPVTITSSMGVIQLVEAFHSLSQQYPVIFAYRGETTSFAAYDGKVSTTKSGNIALSKLAVHTAVWWLQNPKKPFEAATLSLIPR